MKILFFGAGTISKIFLENIYMNGHSILAITHLDKSAQRGQKILPPEVKTLALERNFPFLQINSFDDKTLQKIKFFNADLGIAVSFGKLIPESVFNIPRLKTLNIHFSLLPKYRGAAPVQYAIFNGDEETGVCAFLIKKSLDSGDIIVSKKIKIDFKDNADSLFSKLIPIGIEAMNESISLLQDKNFKPKKQEGSISLAPLLKKEDGYINWNNEALIIYNKIRGLYSWPCAYSMIASGDKKLKRLKIIDTDIFDLSSYHNDFGIIGAIERNKGFIVYCKKGSLLIKTVQPESKPKMSAWDFIQGRNIQAGDLLR